MRGRRLYEQAASTDKHFEMVDDAWHAEMFHGGPKCRDQVIDWRPLATAREICFSFNMISRFASKCSDDVCFSPLGKCPAVEKVTDEDAAPGSGITRPSQSLKLYPNRWKSASKQCRSGSQPGARDG